jgi:hypothetical protein
VLLCVGAISLQIFGICVKYIKKISGARGPKQYGTIDYGCIGYYRCACKRCGDTFS